jgi:hypothetical protein
MCVCVASACQDVWQGGQDVNVPRHAGEHLRTLLPAARFFFLPEEGHFSILGALERDDHEPAGIDHPWPVTSEPFAWDQVTVLRARASLRAAAAAAAMPRRPLEPVR